MIYPWANLQKFTLKESGNDYVAYNGFCRYSGKYPLPQKIRMRIVNTAKSVKKPLMTKTELVKRYILFIISLFFSGLGVAFTKIGGLGVSPISSLANVLNIRFDSISIGVWLVVTNFMLVLLQKAILRRQFRPIQLLQIPLAAVFGYFTDLGLVIVSNIPVNTYVMQIVMVVTGSVVLGLGITLAVTASVIMNAGESVVQILSQKLNISFGTIKIVFDVCYVAFSALVSIILFSSEVYGIREGTLIVAALTGVVVKFFVKILKKPLETVLKGK